MGISNLLPFVKKATRPGKIDEFRGQTLAVDVSGWLHRGIFGCVDKIMTGTPTDLYIRYCLKYIKMLLSYNIHVILVFDGQSLPAKKEINDGRREKRRSMKSKGLELLKEGRQQEARQCFERATEVTFDLVQGLISACRSIVGVDVILAPYEADAQIAFLCQEGIAQAAVTEDSDLIVFGCKKIFFKMNQNGNGTVYERDLLYKTLGFKNPSQFSFTNFRRICIVSGCDYIPEGLKGVGLGKAAKFFTKTTKRDLRMLKRIPLFLNMPNLRVTDQFIDNFRVAETTFLYQLVFDPIEGRLKPLTPYASEEIQSSQASSSSSQSTEIKSQSEAVDLPPPTAKDFPHAGQIVSPRKAREFSLGNVHPHSKDRIGDYSPRVLGKWSVWSPDFKPGVHERLPKSPRKKVSTGFEIISSQPKPTEAKSSGRSLKRSLGSSNTSLNSPHRDSPRSRRSPTKVNPLAGIPDEIADIYGLNRGTKRAAPNPKSLLDNITESDDDRESQDPQPDGDISESGDDVVEIEGASKAAEKSVAGHLSQPVKPARENHRDDAHMHTASQPIPIERTKPPTSDLSISPIRAEPEVTRDKPSKTSLFVSKYFHSEPAENSHATTSSERTRNPFRVPRLSKAAESNGGDDEDGSASLSAIASVSRRMDKFRCPLLTQNSGKSETPIKDTAKRQKISSDRNSNSEDSEPEEAEMIRSPRQKKVHEKKSPDPKAKKKKKQSSPRKKAKPFVAPFLRKGWTPAEQHEFTIRNILKGAVSATANEYTDYSKLYITATQSETVLGRNPSSDEEVNVTDDFDEDSEESQKIRSHEKSFNFTSIRAIDISLEGSVDPAPSSPAPKRTKLGPISRGCKVSGLSKNRVSPRKQMDSSPAVKARLNKFEFSKGKVSLF